MRQPEFEEVVPYLPNTFNEIITHFPKASDRGLRNKLNKWVKEGKLFTNTLSSEKRGAPEKIYTLEQPTINQLTSELISVQCDLAEVIRTNNRKKLIAIYKRIGNILLD
jgi:predicted ArsR family transcriptional regulator